MSQQSLKDKVMEINNYAPVIIPTLNRFEHFKRCLESLERCTGAEHTEVYVALDFPPSEKYKDGWSKIDEYLHKKENNNNFKKLHVVRRDHNCGICTENANDTLLLRDLCKLTNKYIYSEDDNEFSPNFLEYINWGLNKYEHDSNIYAICGFKRVNVDFLDNNVFAFQKFAPWGFGCWFSKKNKRDRLATFENIEVYLKRFRFYRIFTKDVVYAKSLITMLKKRVIYGDMSYRLLPSESQWCIFPKVSLVRNYGHDGTGQHGSGTDATYKMYMENKMDDSKTFVPIIKDNLYDPRLDSIFANAYPVSLKLRIWSMYVVTVYKLFGVQISR